MFVGGARGGSSGLSRRGPRGDDWRNLHTDFERQRAGHAGALVLWFVAVDGVAGAAVVDNIRTHPMWGHLFWFVQWRGDDWRDLCADFERRCAGALVLWFVAVAIVCVVVVDVDMRGKVSSVSANQSVRCRSSTTAASLWIDYLSTRQNRRREALRGPQQRRSQRDPDAMDIDAASISEGDKTGWRDRGGLSKTERKKRQQEGRCFLCGQQGHMRRACPKKKDEGGKQGNESNRTERARVVTTEQENEINQQGRNEQGIPVLQP